MTIVTLARVGAHTRTRTPRSPPPSSAPIGRRRAGPDITPDAAAPDMPCKLLDRAVIWTAGACVHARRARVLASTHEDPQTIVPGMTRLACLALAVAAACGGPSKPVNTVPL